ncbi:MULTISPECIES: MATE family efflux transporter [Flammeovirga]|uniref:Multidrug export protein MepA n=1 Tax=Flammeovirga agarivorans TaxID=2726742 RepID=A0A7X8SI04_9BACT|nr:MULTISPECIES: MATE family efflux transporter [Flammeovirga]NLR90624.1 MATE family efflux transporter [Flammeovirga agarivorans]
MSAKSHPDLGVEPIKNLLIKMSVPAAAGMLVMVIYQMADTFFIGRWVGTLGLAGISVVSPLILIIQSIGMAIGIGGSSLISRALGAKNRLVANQILGNQILIVSTLTILAVVLGKIYEEPLLIFFGANGEIYSFAQEYYAIVLWGIPFLTWSIVANNAVRSEGNAKTAMFAMVVPSVINIILDPILIVGLDWGMKGAAVATFISYIIGSVFLFIFFKFGKTELSISLKYLKLKQKYLKEILGLSSASFTRQAASSVIAIILNHILYDHGGEVSVAVYGVISRLYLLASFPMIGLGQGFLTISSFNYGAKKYQRVKDVIVKSIKYGVVINLVIIIIIFIFDEKLTSLFTNDQQLIEESIPAIYGVMTCLPIVTIGIMASMYAQSLGKAKDALLLTLNRQVLFRIPFVYIFSYYWGISGTWLSFFFSDIASILVASIYMRRKVLKLTKYIKQKEI